MALLSFKQIRNEPERDERIEQLTPYDERTVRFRSGINKVGSMLNNSLSLSANYNARVFTVVKFNKKARWPWRIASV